MRFWVTNTMPELPITNAASDSLEYQFHFMLKTEHPAEDWHWMRPDYSIMWLFCSTSTRLSAQNVQLEP